MHSKKGPVNSLHFVKPVNILIDDFLIQKIVDFELSKIDKSKSDQNNSLYDKSGNYTKGMPAYMSSEIWERNEYTQYSNVYTFSSIMYEILRGDILFEKSISKSSSC